MKENDFGKPQMSQSKRGWQLSLHSKERTVMLIVKHTWAPDLQASDEERVEVYFDHGDCYEIITQEEYGVRMEYAEADGHDDLGDEVITFETADRVFNGITERVEYLRLRWKAIKMLVNPAVIL